MKNDKKQLDSKIISLAGRILDEKVGLAEGCQKIFLLLCAKGIESEKDFLIFTLIASETDQYSSNRGRKYWNKAALKVKDKELESLENFYRKDVIAGCEKLISKLHKTA